MESQEVLRFWLTSISLSLVPGFVLAVAVDMRRFSRLIFAWPLGLFTRTVRMLAIGACAVMGYAAGNVVAAIMWPFIQMIVLSEIPLTPEREAEIGLYVFLFFSALLVWLGTGLGMVLVETWLKMRGDKHSEPPSTGPFRGA